MLPRMERPSHRCNPPLRRLVRTMRPQSWECCSSPSLHNKYNEIHGFRENHPLFASPPEGAMHKECGIDREVSTVWISLVAGVGAFSVSLLSIYLGYELFLAGATGAFKFSAQGAGTSVGFESVAPGLAFAFFGAGIAIYAL